jgi:hypothetical protein
VVGQVNAVGTAVIRATVPRDIRDQLEEERWQARTSLSAHIAAILTRHCEATQPEVPENGPSRRPGRISPGRTAPSLTKAQMGALARLGYSWEQVTRMSSDEIRTTMAGNVRAPGSARPGHAR